MTDAQRKTLSDLMVCCLHWQPQVCVMGNVRAGDAAAAICAVLEEDAANGAIGEREAEVLSKLRMFRDTADVAGELYRISIDIRYANNRRDMFEAVLAREYGAALVTGEMAAAFSANQPDERGAFEAQVKSPLFKLSRSGDGYEDETVDHMWSGWQARAASPQATATQPAQTQVALMQLLADCVQIIKENRKRIGYEPGSPNDRTVREAIAILASQPASGADHE